MTLTAPAKIFDWSDIPQRVPGGAKYMPGPVKRTGNQRDIIMQTAEGESSVIDTAPNAQAAFRKAIRWQKRENAAATKAAKRGRSDQ